MTPGEEYSDRNHGYKLAKAFDEPKACQKGAQRPQRDSPEDQFLRNRAEATVKKNCRESWLPDASRP